MRQKCVRVLSSETRFRSTFLMPGVEGVEGVECEYAKGQGQRQGKGESERCGDRKGGMSKNWGTEGLLAKKSGDTFTFFKQSSPRAHNFERWIHEFKLLIFEWIYWTSRELWYLMTVEFLPHWVWSMNSCWSVSGCSSTEAETTALTSDHVEHKRHG